MSFIQTLLEKLKLLPNVESKIAQLATAIKHYENVIAQWEAKLADLETKVNSFFPTTSQPSSGDTIYPPGTK